VKHHLTRHWFLIGLALVLGAGFTLSPRLAWLADATVLRNGIVAAVMFLMALPLQFGEIWRVLRRPWAALLAVSVSFGLLPLIAWGASLGLRGDLAIGLLITAAMPCTLASAAVWTRKAGGNDAVAIFVTIITNVTCFIVTPLWLLAMTHRGDVEIPLADMIVKLGLLVVLPIIVAQALRLYRPLGAWATGQTMPLGVAAQCGILLMVLIGSVASGRELAAAESQQSPAVWEFAAMIVLVVAVHLSTFLLGYAAARLLGMGRADQTAVGFSGSQKTLMVGLYVATTYYGGMTILPMVAYHVGQLVVDTVIAHRLRSDNSTLVPNARDC